MYNVHEVLKLAHGRWDSILRDLATVDLSVQIKAGSHNCSCPVHQGDNGFSFFSDWIETGGGGCFVCHDQERMPSNGINFLLWVNGITFKEALDAVGDWVKADKEGLKKHAVHKSAPRKPATPVIDDLKKQKNLQIWHEAVTVENAPLLRDYLENRGLRTNRLPTSIRFHPKQEYRIIQGDGTSKLIGVWPCMIAPVQRLDGMVVGLHRTYLDPETAHKVVLENGLSPKRLTPGIYDGCYRGAGIRLSHIDEPIVGVAEGIETGLAVTSIMPIAFLVGISASFLPNLQFSKNTHAVQIYLDRDAEKTVNGKQVGRAGQLRALQLSERLADEGITSALYMPPGRIEGKSRDWLDVYNRDGIRKMPKREDRIVLDTLTHT